MRSFSFFILLINFAFSGRAQIPLSSWDFNFFHKEKEIFHSLTAPPEARRFILSWQKGGEYFCLFYQVPRASSYGRIFFQKQILKNCLWDPHLKENTLLEKLSSLKIAFSSEAKGLKLVYQREGQTKEEFWPLPNMQNPKREKKHSSRLFERGIPGVFFPGHQYKSPSLWGSQNDNYREGTALLCHDFDKTCKEKMPFQCERCRYGWFEVVGYGCAQGGRKFCGRNRCGQRGQPACLRGFRHIVDSLSLEKKRGPLCRDDSPMAFCQIGLRVICDSRRILVCR